MAAPFTSKVSGPGPLGSISRSLIENKKTILLVNCSRKKNENRSFSVNARNHRVRIRIPIGSFSRRCLRGRHPRPRVQIHRVIAAWVGLTASAQHAKRHQQGVLVCERRNSIYSTIAGFAMRTIMELPTDNTMVCAANLTNLATHISLSVHRL